MTLATVPAGLCASLICSPDGAYRARKIDPKKPESYRSYPIEDRAVRPPPRPEPDGQRENQPANVPVAGGSSPNEIPSARAAITAELPTSTCDKRLTASAIGTLAMSGGR